ncbi:MAG: glutamine--fructose-6-phosphate transaminase (isomerizing) [Pseudomonadota bacterium]
MCGIVGVLGKNEVAPLILEGLKRLEYRGYDSAGIATVNDGRLDRRRAIGKLAALSDLLVHDPILGKSGIGHTRWATHGAATLANAHPHRAGPVAVVHNGIIENYRPLREELQTAGVTFETDTDTEVVAQLCAHLMAGGKDPVAAVEATLPRLSGAFALLFLFEGKEDLLIAARRGSPLALGHGNGEMFVGSDAQALAMLTNRITYLEEGDWAIVRRAGAEVRTADGALANREVRLVAIDAVMADKADYKHFMAKEMHEQPTVSAYVHAHYLSADRSRVEIEEGKVDFTEVDRILLVACGTASYACQVAKYWFEAFAGIPAEVDIASEFRYREPPLTDRTMAIFLSQSGETADTLAALRHCQDRVGRIVAVVNQPESTIAREADLALPILAGAEICVASTKAFTNMLMVLAVLAVLAARQRGTLDAEGEAAKLATLSHTSGAFREALMLERQIQGIARELARARDVLFLGRGPLFPIAMEGALKLKEISYIHAEGYASGELKHGPIALIDEGVPVVVFAPRDALFEKTVSNMQEVMARGGRIVLITDAAGAAEASGGAWHTLVMPQVDPLIAPIVYAVPAQLLAYHTAVMKGTDVDQPRNLAKSVTVE